MAWKRSGHGSRFNHAHFKSQTCSNSGTGGIGRSLTVSRPFLEDAFRSFGAASGLGAEVDLLLSKYAMALESEECMDRIICELGVNASGLQGKELFFR